MKKYFCLALVSVLILSTLCLSGCGEGMGEDVQSVTPGLKLGVGSFSSMKASDAEDSEFLGEAGLSVTVAALLLNDQGRILSCKVDAIENAVNFTVKGQAQGTAEPISKYEQGFDYKMSVYGLYQDKNGDNKVLEWFQQADAFCETAKGKTLEELKALVNETGMTSGELSTAGCTINCYDFIKAVEKAFNNTLPTTAKPEDSLEIGFAAASSSKNATKTENGEIKNTFSFSVVAISTEKAVSDVRLDVSESTVEFDAKGVALTPKTEISTKKELGDNYHMAAYGNDANGDGIVLEWYKQAQILEKSCVGKDADEISSLVINGYQGTQELQKAGCTIGISDLINATLKALRTV